MLTSVYTVVEQLDFRLGHGRGFLRGLVTERGISNADTATIGPDKTKGRGRGALSYGEASEYVYKELKRGILQGTLPGGTRLVETAIARDFDVSRTPVREAIQLLVAEGVVERTTSRGLIVVEVTSHMAEDVYVTRMELEGLASRLAAQRRSSHDLAALREIQDELEAAQLHGDSERMARINFAFHSEIQRIAGNSTTSRFMAQIHETVQRFGPTTLALPERAQEAMQEHRELIAALENQDGELAQAIAKRHLEGALRARLITLTRNKLNSEG